ncbi:MAG: hypothetical protein KJZ81_07810 [Burkholderiaceae bacterium]|nr:hypothetical protein [Burkholderiaceae bacterium]
MTGTPFRLRAVAALTVDRRRLVRGSQFEAGAATAALLLRDGVAVLVDAGDMPRLVRALGADAGRRPAPLVR